MSIKRILNSIKADVMFQLKHGFYTIYVVLAIIYIILLSFLSPKVTSYVLPLLIYFDPAGLGLFFIGGMVLLEKEQGILALLYITPLRVYEYILSKVVTLGIISIIAGVAISLISYSLSVNYVLLCIAVFLVSIVFTLIGFILSTRSKSVNEYLLKMIPISILFFVPCLSLIPNDIIPSFVSYLLYAVPSVAGLKLVIGAYLGLSTLDIVLCLISLVVFNALLVKKVAKILANRVILDD